MRAFLAALGIGYWQCAHCGQANPNHSNTCWKCGASK